MMDSDIPPLWLRPEPARGDGRRFRLPLLLRTRIGGEGIACVLLAEGGAPLRVDILGTGDRVLAEAALGGGVAETVFLPPEAQRLRVTSEADIAALRLGYYPVHKVALKLHAFANGSFPAQSPGARWKSAGAAARALRGALHALMAASPATGQRNAVRYRRYRARFVGDVRTVPAADAAPRLAFLTPLGDLPPSVLAGCGAALAAQTDRNFDWVVALPAGRALGDADLAALSEYGARTVTAAAPSLAAQMEAACAAAQAGIVLPLDPVARLTPDAVAILRDAFARHPDCRLLYTDEERLDADGVPVGGVFKPAFNRHLLEATGYMGRLVALPRADALRLGFAPAAGEACLYDLILRHATKLAAQEIRHVPRVTVGFPARLPGFPPAEIGPAADALARLLAVPVEIVGGGRHLRPRFAMPDPAPLVSVVVPTRDRAGLLGTALRSLIARTRYRAFEIIVVDNGSVEPQTFALFEEIKAAWPRTTIVRDDGDFNFPRICNAGVAASQGALILLLNNDIEVVDGDWLGEMVALAHRPRTGIVGAKLLYPDRTVQHAGVMVGLFRYAEHWFAHSAADAPGLEDRLLVRQNLSAVTAACLLVRREVWDGIGPLDAVRFAEDCNDIDLCLRARRAGHEVVFTPFTGLVHHESASRGRKRTKAHRARLKAQRERMEAAWHTARFVDPHYNPNLARNSLFAALAEAPEGPRDPRTDDVWSPAPKHLAPQGSGTP